MNSRHQNLPKINHIRNHRKAQAAVEFALILPIALLMVFTIIEIARMAQAWLVITNAARVGLRYAVTGAYDPVFCTSENDVNDNDLFCAQEPDKDSRNEEIDIARLLSIYELTENSAVGIMKDLSITDKNEVGYYHVTVCSTNREPEPDGEVRVYHPPPDDFCSPFDHPGDPSVGSARVLVSVTFEHPVILPILNQIAPSITLHAKRTGIVEQFRVARVLGLPPVISVPSATPLPPTITPTPSDTPTPSLTPTPSDTPMPSLTPTQTDTPTATATHDPFATPTPTRTIPPTRRPTQTATQTPIPTNTEVPSDTPVPSDTLTPSSTPSATPTSDLPTSTPTETTTPTNTPRATLPGGG